VITRGIKKGTQANTVQILVLPILTMTERLVQFLIVLLQRYDLCSTECMETSSPRIAEGYHKNLLGLPVPELIDQRIGKITDAVV